jgi:hypothetical protein
MSERRLRPQLTKLFFFNMPTFTLATMADSGPSTRAMDGYKSLKPQSSSKMPNSTQNREGGTRNSKPETIFE